MRAIVICCLILFYSACSTRQQKVSRPTKKYVENRDDADNTVFKYDQSDPLTQPEVLRASGQTSKFVVYEDAPFAVQKYPPVYPEFAKTSGIDGEVWLEVEVFEDGTVGAVEVKQSVMSGPGGLDESAINTVKKWKFKPAKSDGRPIACWVMFPVGFLLNR